MSVGRETSSDGASARNRAENLRRRDVPSRDNGRDSGSTSEEDEEEITTVEGESSSRRRRRRRHRRHRRRCRGAGDHRRSERRDARARSESSLYERRRRAESYGESWSEANEYSEEDGRSTEEATNGERTRRRANVGKSGSEKFVKKRREHSRSDDSLEVVVVVVKKSLEKKTERSRGTRTVSVNDETTRLATEPAETKENTSDSASQGEAGERVTVTAIVHENQETPDDVKLIRETGKKSTPVITSVANDEIENLSEKLSTNDADEDRSSLSASTPVEEVRSLAATTDDAEDEGHPNTEKNNASTAKVSSDESADKKEIGQVTEIDEQREDQQREQEHHEHEQEHQEDQSPENQELQEHLEEKGQAIPEQPQAQTEEQRQATDDKKAATRTPSLENIPTPTDDRVESSNEKPRSGKSEESEDSSPGEGRAIVAVIESPEWHDDEKREIRDTPPVQVNTEAENAPSVFRVLASNSEEETPRTRLPRVERSTGRESDERRERSSDMGGGKQRRDSAGRDSGIEPSPRVCSKIPTRTSPKRYRSCMTRDDEQQRAPETITRDVQASLRRYHLERKIFFQLMELKRLQIRHGRANERVLVKRQVESFHKAGMSGPTLGVAKYDQPLTFRHFEAFLYEQLRRLQRRPATPDFCTEAKQCTQKTHRCHHATSAYTSLPVYTCLDGVGGQERDQERLLLPRIETRARGRMTVQVTRGCEEEKQVMALPAESLDRAKRYYVTFTVRGGEHGPPAALPLRGVAANSSSHLRANKGSR